MEAVKQDENHHSQKRFRLQETLEDRISVLPDELITQILSLLPATVDAVRTSTLSRRWKSAWTLIPTLTIRDVPYGRQGTFDCVPHINETLTRCHHSKLNKFEISVRYLVSCPAEVDTWIRYAISRKVEGLDVTLNSGFEPCKFVLDEDFLINSYFRYLRFRDVTLNPNGAISWKKLRTLCIYDAELGEDMIKNILCGAPMLETLELGNCGGYTRLDIASKSVKNLVLRGYFDPTDRFEHPLVIEINAPNILSLKILGVLRLGKILLADVSSVVEAELNYRHLFLYYQIRWEEHTNPEVMLKRLIESLRHVKELKAGTYCARGLSRLKVKGFSFPSTMKCSDDVFCFPLKQKF